MRSAQLDHVVIGPSGVYVIETKAWSAAFGASGAGFDPCEQVCRAGLLCHVLLKEAGLPCRVRNVIARCGHLPDSSHMRRVSLRTPEQLTHTIRAGRTRLNDDQVHAIGRHLWHTYGDVAA